MHPGRKNGPVFFSNFGPISEKHIKFRSCYLHMSHPPKKKMKGLSQLVPVRVHVLSQFLHFQSSFNRRCSPGGSVDASSG